MVEKEKVWKRGKGFGREREGERRRRRGDSFQLCIIAYWLIELVFKARENNI